MWCDNAISQLGVLEIELVMDHWRSVLNHINFTVGRRQCRTPAAVSATWTSRSRMVVPWFLGLFVPVFSLFSQLSCSSLASPAGPSISACQLRMSQPYCPWRAKQSVYLLVLVSEDEKLSSFLPAGDFTLFFNTLDRKWEKIILNFTYSSLIMKTTLFFHLNFCILKQNNPINTHCLIFNACFWKENPKDTRIQNTAVSSVTLTTHESTLANDNDNSHLLWQRISCPSPLPNGSIIHPSSSKINRTICAC